MGFDSLDRRLSYERIMSNKARVDKTVNIIFKCADGSSAHA